MNGVSHPPSADGYGALADIVSESDCVWPQGHDVGEGLHGMDNTLCIAAAQYTLYRTRAQARATMCSMGTTLNERLRQARINAGFEKAGDFAKAVGVQEGTYRHHENGTGGRGVPLSAAKKYAKKLGVDLNWLLNGEDVPAPIEPLSAEDQELLARFKRLPATKRRSFLDILPELPASRPDQQQPDDQE